MTKQFPENEVSAFLLRLPAELMNKVRVQAKKEIRSINDLIRNAVEKEYDKKNTKTINQEIK